MRDPGWLTRFVERLKKLGTAIQTAVLAQRISVDQVLERVGIVPPAVTSLAGRPFGSRRQSGLVQMHRAAAGS